MAKSSLVEQMYLSHVLDIDPIKIQPEYLCFYPPLLSGLAKAFQNIIHSLSFHFIFPTDPHAIPLATHLSHTHNKPLFLCLDTNAFIQNGQRALLVHTSPSAQDFQKSVKALKAHKIDVSDALV